MVADLPIFPVSEVVPNLLSALQAGKTTLVPLHLLAAPGAATAAS